LAAAAGNPLDASQLTTATVGGKSVYVYTDPTDESKGYVYVSGDSLLTFNDVTDSQANKLIAAFP
jgi:hypothetical protein